MDSYIVMWERVAGGCPAGSVSSMTVSNNTTNYTITDLEEGSNYSITVQAHNSVGHGDSERLHSTTQTTGLLKYISRKLFLIRNSTYNITKTSKHY